MHATDAALWLACAVVCESMLVLLLAASILPCRQHYIPHRKSDWVKGQQVPRASRRVSLTFRKVRNKLQSCMLACCGPHHVLESTVLTILQWPSGQVDQMLLH